MKNSEAIILTPVQAARVDRIKSYHAACIKSFGDQMGYAFLSGLELNAAKAELPHGQFTAWREAHLPKLPERSAQRYMAFHDSILKSATVADLPIAGNPLLLENGKTVKKLPRKEKVNILKAISEFADGKTLTQLYRDLGVIRAPKKSEGRKPVDPTDPEDPDDSEFVTEVENDMLLLADDHDKSLETLSASALAKFQRAHHLLGERIKTIVQARKTART